MKITKTKLAAATFGAALTSLYAAPELNAQIDIVFDPGSVDVFAGNYSTNTVINPVQFLNVISGSYNIPGVDNAAVGVFNDSFGVAIFNDFPDFGNNFNGGISQFGLAEAGDFFTTGTTPNLAFGPGETGIRYIGFVAGGAVGWFSIDLGTTPNDAVVFTGGQFNEGGGVGGITVGVPEPSSVGLAALALGAIGLRRRRKSATAA